MSMKRPFLFGALIALSLASTIAHATWDFGFLSECAHSSSMRKLFRQGKGGKIPPKLAASSDTDVQHCNLQIDVNPTTKFISGSNVMTIKSNVNGLTTFDFRLINNYTVNALLIDGVANSFTRLDVNTVRVTISSRVVNLGDVFQLQVDYSGTAPTASGFGSIVFGTRSTGAQYVFTLSEPWHAHEWWPVKDDNADKATFDFWVTVPNTLTVTSNGPRQGIDTVAGSKLRYRFKTDYPMAPYLLCFAATVYNSWTQTYTYSSGTMPVEFFIFPENDTTSNRNAWNLCVQMLATYQPIFGLYPFVNEKYGIYQFNFGGGMEHQTNTGQGTFSESVTAHELGHQWWGDMVTCKSWHDIWLNEGFATYTEALWLEKKPGSSGFAALKSAMQSRKPSAVNDSVYCYDISNENRIFSTNFTYRKGGWVLHMLRKILGDTAFFNALAHYRSKFEYDSAITDDFIAAVEESTGRDLDWFFQPWVYQPGAVAYQYGTKVVNVDGDQFLLVKLVQNQSASYPTYSMPVDFRYTVNSTVFTKPLWNTARNQWYIIPITGTPSAMSVDPDGWILTTSTGTTTYTEGPPTVIGASIDSSPDTIRISIRFHKGVVVDRPNFKVIVNGSDEQFKLKYDESGYGAYLYVPHSGSANVQVTVYDTIVAADNGMQLDGEFGGNYPSGDGLPGGSTVLNFNIP